MTIAAIINVLYQNARNDLAISLISVNARRILDISEGAVNSARIIKLHGQKIIYNKILYSAEGNRYCLGFAIKC